MFTASTVAHEPFIWMDSNSWETSSWDDSVSGPLRLQGQGQHIHETIAIYNEPETNAQGFEVAVDSTSDFTVNYPGGANYTLDVGYFSLYGASANETWTSTNGSSINLERALTSIHNEAAVGSVSYALTLGSATFGLSGSCVLGGYDRSRCLTDPITSKNSTFGLIDIGLTVQSGSSAFVNTSNSSVNGLLSENASTELNVVPNPGVPYFYLPKATCDAIAQYLPVTYNADFGLYIWNTSNPAFEKIVSSPHALSLTFNSSTSTANSTIYVPFALLNLTLESPLVVTSTQYFPCSPYTPSDGTTYHLGRAFLQAAFSAHNWQTNTSWLSQAPGPELPSEEITVIHSSDTTLSAMTNGPHWYSTWSNTLKPLNGSSSTSTSATTTTKSSHLSGGAIAGIVIGVLAGIALLSLVALFFLRRKRRAVAKSQSNRDYALTDQSDVHEAAQREIMEAPATEIHEAEAAVTEAKAVNEKPAEMEDPHYSHVSELPGSDAMQQDAKYK